MDHLKQALSHALGRPAAEPAARSDDLPDPLQSAWIQRLRELGGEVPPSPSMGQLTQRSDALARALQASGRARLARELTSLKEGFLRDREREAWSRVKLRFAELELPDRAYRALKQEETNPEKLLPKLTGRRGEALRGMGADRLREALTRG